MTLRTRKVALQMDPAVKVEQLCSICGIGDAVTARAVLEGSGWDLDAAADFYFATGASHPTLAFRCFSNVERSYAQGPFGDNQHLKVDSSL